MKTHVPVFLLVVIFSANITATAQKTSLALSGLKPLDSLLRKRETDPKVAVTALNSVPRWDGSKLVNGTLYDNGYAVGIHTTDPQTSLHVLGNDETLTLEEATANSLGTGTMMLLKGHTANQSPSEGRIGMVPEDGFYPYRSGAIEIRPQSRINFYKSFGVTDPSNLAMTIVGSGIGIGTPNPSPSAVLDIRSASQGLLIPRMGKEQRKAISYPDNGLIVYQTGDSSGIYYYADTAWKMAGATAGTCASSLAAGSGISIANGTITNTAPDQKITIETGGTIAASGTYPNFYLTSPEVTLAPGYGIKIGGQFPHYTISLAGKLPAPQDNSIDITSLKDQIAKQQSEIDELKAMITSLASPAGDKAAGNMVMSFSGASLSQNVPNPFRGTAVINYTLPAACASARLIINDNSGKKVKEIGLSGKGSGSVVIDASVLPAGSYRYSLMIDSKLVDTKQMVVVK